MKREHITIVLVLLIVLGGAGAIYQFYFKPRLLKYSEDLKRSEIATILEIPEATVKSRLYHAIRCIRQNMLPSDGAM